MCDVNRRGWACRDNRTVDRQKRQRRACGDCGRSGDDAKIPDHK
jgi:hypothetical protein